MSTEDAFSPFGCDVEAARRTGWRTPENLSSLFSSGPSRAAGKSYKRPRGSNQIEKARQRRCSALQAAAPNSPSVITEVRGRSRAGSDPFDVDESLIGQRVEIWWDGDGSWYKGTILGYSTGTAKPHHLRYDDNEEEMINLCNETWRVTKEAPATEGQEAAPAEEPAVRKRAAVATERARVPQPKRGASATKATEGAVKGACAPSKRALKGLRQNAVVWARMQGHPWWPAKLFPEAEQTEPKHKYVFFFGTGQWGLLPESAVLPFDGDVTKFAPKKRRDAWERAVADATQMWMAPSSTTSKGGQEDDSEDR